MGFSMIIDENSEVHSWLNKKDYEWKNGINPDSRYPFIPKQMFVGSNSRKLTDNNQPFPPFNQVFENKDGSANYMKRIFDWYLGLGEFQWDAVEGEVKYPNQGFFNTNTREEGFWHWATEVLVQKIKYGRRLVKYINKNYYNKQIIAFSVCNDDFSGNTNDLNNLIREYIQMGYHVIIVSCGKYTEASTLPEVLFTLDLTDGESFDRTFQFLTRGQSSFYGYKYFFYENNDFIKNDKILFWKNHSIYITLSQEKHLSMIVNALNFRDDILGGKYETILNKIKNNSMLLGYDVNELDIKDTENFVRETYYGSKLEGSIRSRINISNLGDILKLTEYLKKAREKNKENKKKEVNKNKNENTNESNYTPGEESNNSNENTNKEEEDVVQLIEYFINNLIKFVKYDYYKDVNINSFNELMSSTIINKNIFLEFFALPKDLIQTLINEDVLGIKGESTKDYFNNIFNLYKIYEK